MLPSISASLGKLAKCLESVRLTGFLFTAICSGILASSDAAAQPLYRESFGNTTNAVRAFNDPNIGWQGHFGPTAVDKSASSAQMQVSRLASLPANLTNINAGTSLSEAIGFAANLGQTLTTPTDGNSIIWTAEYPVLHTAEIGEINWYLGCYTTNTPDTFRVALRIDNGSSSNWFVTTQTFTSAHAVFSGADFVNPTNGATLQTFGFTHAGAAWAGLNFIPGVALVVGATLNTNLLDGIVTGFGLYADSQRGTQRFDTYTIHARPTLSVTTNSTDVSVTWPEPATGFRLETASKVDATNWTDVTNFILGTNSQKTATFTRTTTNQFYRLVRP